MSMTTATTSIIGKSEIIQNADLLLDEKLGKIADMYIRFKERMHIMLQEVSPGERTMVLSLIKIASEHNCSPQILEAAQFFKKEFKNEF